jgi:2-polyprenyl-3-methyl-5-hydroxy-6-metoxy-1,4-benzoquinol methylase
MKSSAILTRRRPRTAAPLEPRSKRRFATQRKQAAGHRSPTPERLMQFAWGYAPPLILEAAVNWRLFDLLEQGPQTIGLLAAQSRASERGLTAILNALVGLEFLVRKGTRYSLTPESAAFLVSTKPAYHGEFFRHISRQLIPNWLRLTEAVGTGRPVVAANEQGKGQQFFAEFVEGLFPLSYQAAQVLGEHLGIPKAASRVSVLDIGAGSGVWGIALAHQSPHVRIRAVDWPAVLEVTSKVARRHGVGNRLRTAAGDLLEADFGTGHQVATIGHILHSEGRERSRRLLRKTFAALAPGGTVVISEFIPNEDRTGPPTPLIFAVNMLLHTAAGDTFTFAEIAGWLREAGFANPRLLKAPAPSPLVLATRH